jgi:hypothetical protein
VKLINYLSNNKPFDWRTLDWILISCRQKPSYILPYCTGCWRLLLLRQKILRKVMKLDRLLVLPHYQEYWVLLVRKVSDAVIKYHLNRSRIIYFRMIKSVDSFLSFQNTSKFLFILFLVENLYSLLFDLSFNSYENLTGFFTPDYSPFLSEAFNTSLLLVLSASNNYLFWIVR